MTSQDQKSHAAPHFDCLDVRTSMLSLMTLSVSCDTGTNGVTVPKMSCCISFLFSQPGECNGAIDDIVSIT